MNNSSTNNVNVGGEFKIPPCGWDGVGWKSEVNTSSNKMSCIRLDQKVSILMYEIVRC